MIANNGRVGLDAHGLRSAGEVFWNLSSAQLYEHAIRNGEGGVCKDGPLVVLTGQHTGRSARDKFVVCDETTKDEVWWGEVNAPYQPDQFDALYERLCGYLEGKNLYVQDCFVGADLDYRLPVRVISELAWHNLFARTMFIEAVSYTHLTLPTILLV